MEEGATKLTTVLEFYSGIGGTHLALRKTGLTFTVKGAFEINTTANAVYGHNFPDVPIMQRNIKSLTHTELDKLDADLWTMSPPCQPFTRQGNQKDIDDERTDSFQHLLEVLQQMTRPPRFLFLENVKGFETSEAHSILMACLNKMNYSITEFLLSPKQFGIPNSRLRYYLLGKLHGTFDELNSIGQSENGFYQTFPNLTYIVVSSISQYLERDKDEQYVGSFCLSETILAKHCEVLDIVRSHDKNSCCFTKGYAHYIQGTGSVLQCNEDADLTDIYEKARQSESNEDKIIILKELRLRWFTPREIANLLCFPQDYNFQDSISVKQQYRLLGNSVNVHVISKLLKLLLSNSVD